MRKVIRIDEDGFFLEDVILQDDELAPKDCISVEVPEGLYKPQWDFSNSAWVEGLTQDELDEIINAPKPVSEAEQLRIEQAKASVELIEFILSLGGHT